MPEETHQFESLTESIVTVLQQLKAGSYRTKMMGITLKKIAAAEIECAEKIIRAINKDGESAAAGLVTRKVIAADGMLSSALQWKLLKKDLVKTAKARKSFGQELQVRVAQPLQKYGEEHDARRKNVGDRLKAHLHKMEAAEAKFAHKNIKLHNALTNAIKEAKAKEEEKKKPLKKKKSRHLSLLSRMVHTNKTAHQILVDMLPKHQKHMNNANNSVDEFHRTLAPKCLQSLKALEVERTARLATSYEVINELSQGLNKSVTLDTQLVCDGKKDVEAFVRRTHADPPTNPKWTYVYDLILLPEDIKAGQLLRGPNAVFGCTIDGIMKKQLKQHPGTTVPRIVSSMSAVVRQGGMQTEGIFRLSADQKEMERTIARFDESGVYELKSQNPILAAAVLKTWIRSLTEPVVPAQLYSDWAKVGRTEDAKPQQARKLLASLPANNRAVITHIAQLVAELVRPANLARTKMTTFNLAVVFSPCFLRNPSTDPQTLMKGLKSETQVVDLVFKSFVTVEPPPVSRLTSETEIGEWGQADMARMTPRRARAGLSMSFDDDEPDSDFG